MKKIYKITNMALIFTLIGATFCQDLYALRIPVNGSKRVGETLASGQEIGPETIREALFKSEGVLKRANTLFDFDLKPYIQKYNIDLQSIKNEVRQERRKYLNTRKRKIKKILQKKQGLPLVTDILKYEVSDIVDFIEIRHKHAREDWMLIIESYKQHVERMRNLDVEEGSNFYSDVVSLFVEEALRLKKKGYLWKVKSTEVAEMLGTIRQNITYVVIKTAGLIREEETENPFLLSDRRLKDGLVFEDIERNDIKILLQYVKPESKSVKPIISKKLLEDYAVHVQMMREAGFTKGRSMHVDYVTAFVRLAKNKALLGDTSPVIDKDIGRFMGYEEDLYGHIGIIVNLKNDLISRISSGWQDCFLLDEKEQRIFAPVFLNIQKNADKKAKCSEEIMKLLVIKEVDRIRLDFKNNDALDDEEFIARIIKKIGSANISGGMHNDFTAILRDIREPMPNDKRVDLLLRLFDFIGLDALEKARPIIAEVSSLATADYRIKFLCSVFISIMDGRTDERPNGLENENLREALIDFLRKTGGVKRKAAEIYFGVAFNRQIEHSFNILLEENNISSEVIEDIKKRRKSYLETRRKDIIRTEVEKGYLDIPLEYEILSYDVDDIVAYIATETDSIRENWINILTSYKEFVRKMKETGITSSSCIYADMVSLFVHEALQIKKRGLVMSVTNEEVALLRGLRDREAIRKDLIKLGKALDGAPFLVDRRFKNGLTFESIKIKQITWLLKYVESKSKKISDKPVITENSFLGYIVHSRLMKKIGVKRGRTLEEDYTTAFIKLAKRKAKIGDASPVTDDDIRKYLGYPEKGFGLYRTKQNMRDRITANCPDIFAATQREHEVFKQAFLKTRRLSRIKTTAMVHSLASGEAVELRNIEKRLDDGTVILSYTMPGIVSSSVNLLDPVKKIIMLGEAAVVAMKGNYQLSTERQSLRGCDLIIIQAFLDGEPCAYAAVHRAMPAAKRVINAYIEEGTQAFDEASFKRFGYGSATDPEHPIQKAIDFLKKLVPSECPIEYRAMVIGGRGAPAMKKGLGEIWGIPVSDSCYYQMPDGMREINVLYDGRGEARVVNPQLEKGEWRGIEIARLKFIGKNRLLAVNEIYPTKREFKIFSKTVLKGEIVIPEDIISRIYSYEFKYESVLEKTDITSFIKKKLIMAMKGGLLFYDVMPSMVVIDKDVKDNDVIGSVIPFSGCMGCIFKGEKDGKTVIVFSHFAMLGSRFVYFLDEVEKLNLDNPCVVFDVIDRSVAGYRREVDKLITMASPERYPTLFKARENNKIWVSESGDNKRKTKILAAKEGIAITTKKGSCPILWNEISGDLPQIRQMIPNSQDNGLTLASGEAIEEDVLKFKNEILREGGLPQKPSWSNNGEYLIRQINKDSPFKTYVVADQLYSLIDDDPIKHEALTVISDVAIEEQVEALVKMEFAEKLGLDGVSILKDAYMEGIKGDVIFIKASAISNKDNEDDYSNEILWHERIHSTINRMNPEKRSLFTKLVKESESDTLRSIGKVIAEDYGLEVGSFDNCAETIAYIFSLIRDINTLQSFIQNAFPPEFLHIFIHIWYYSKPTYGEVNELEGTASNIYPYISDTSYFSLIEAITTAPEEFCKEVLNSVGYLLKNI